MSAPLFLTTLTLRGRDFRPILKVSEITSRQQLTGRVLMNLKDTTQGGPNV